MSKAKPVEKECLLELRRLMLERDRRYPAKLEYDAAEARVLAYLRELQLDADVPNTTALNEDGSWAGEVS